MKTKTFQIHAKDYVCMSFALTAAAEIICRQTGKTFEQVSAELTTLANERLNNTPEAFHQEIVNSYFVSKEHGATATITTFKKP